MSKYELLEEEHINVRMKFQEEKERAESSAKQSRRDYDRVNMELTALRESVQSRHDAHTKEKLEFQSYIHEIEMKLKRFGESEHEKQKLKHALKERDAQVDELKRTERSLREERERLKTRVRASLR